MEFFQRQVQQLTAVKLLATLGVLVPLALFTGCLNPFAPGRDDSPAESTCDPTTIDGVFRCFQAAYTFRDTSVYGQLLGADFIFVYRDYEKGIDVTWGRHDEMRTTYGLFQNAQRLDLIWNIYLARTEDDTSANVIRGFSLTITFNPSDIQPVTGYANFTFRRARTTDPWKIVRWRDESNF